MSNENKPFREMNYHSETIKAQEIKDTTSFMSTKLPLYPGQA